MKLKVCNEGETPVRVIIDQDTVNDEVLDPDAEDVFEASQGIIEFRELDESEEGGVREPEGA
jgi:hypothetical protein